MAWVGRDLNDHLVPSPLHGQNCQPLHRHQLRVPRAPSSPAWCTSRDGASTVSLGRLCQCFTNDLQNIMAIPPLLVQMEKLCLLMLLPQFSFHKDFSIKHNHNVFYLIIYSLKLNFGLDDPKSSTRLSKIVLKVVL